MNQDQSHSVDQLLINPLKSSRTDDNPSSEAKEQDEEVIIIRSFPQQYRWLMDKVFLELGVANTPENIANIVTINEAVQLLKDQFELDQAIKYKKQRIAQAELLIEEKGCKLKKDQEVLQRLKARANELERMTEKQYFKNILALENHELKKNMEYLDSHLEEIDQYEIHLQQVKEQIKQREEQAKIINQRYEQMREIYEKLDLQLDNKIFDKNKQIDKTNEAINKLKRDSDIKKKQLAQLQKEYDELLERSHLKKAQEFEQATITLTLRDRAQFAKKIEEKVTVIEEIGKTKKKVLSGIAGIVVAILVMILI